MRRRAALGCIWAGMALFGCSDEGGGAAADDPFDDYRPGFTGNIRRDASVIDDDDRDPPPDGETDAGLPDEWPDGSPGTDAGGGEPAEACRAGEQRACPDPTCAGGTQTCRDGRWAPCVGPAETCNGRDDDCDGQTDEDFPGLGEPCTTGSDGCTSEGRQVCAPDGAGLTCDAPPAAPEPERCDGLDNDCDGVTDEDFPEVCCSRDEHCLGAQRCVDNRCVDEGGGGGGGGCAAPQRIAEALVQGDTSAGGAVHEGSCGGAGGEQVYVLEVVEPARLLIAVEPMVLGVDPVLYVRTACGDPASEIACNDDAGLGFGSEVVIDAVPGTTYFVFVDDVGLVGGGGPFLLGVELLPAPECMADADCGDGVCVDGECRAPPEPVAGTCESPAPLQRFGVYPGSTRGLPSEHAGACARLSDRSPEQVFTFTLDEPARVRLETDAAWDTVLYVRTECAEPASGIACDDDSGGRYQGAVEIDAAAGTPYYVFVDGFDREQGEFDLHFSQVAVGPMCAADDDCEGAACLGGVCHELPADGACADPGLLRGPGEVRGTTVGRPNRLSPARGCTPRSDAPEAVFALSSPTADPITLSTEGSALDTVLYVIPACEVGPDAVCDDDGAEEPLASSLTFEPEPGRLYFVVVDGYGEGEGEFVLTWR